MEIGDKPHREMRRHALECFAAVTPLWGIGLDLPELLLWDQGQGIDEVREALKGRLLAPLVDVGIKFNPEPDNLGLGALSFLLECEIGQETGYRPSAETVENLTNKFAQIIPVYSLPGWLLGCNAFLGDAVNSEHVKQALAHLKAHSDCLDALPKNRTRQMPLPVTSFSPGFLPSHVRQEDMLDFCALYPGLGERLWRIIVEVAGGNLDRVEANLANAAVSEALMVEVDVSAGYLFPAEHLGDACEFALCEPDKIKMLPLVGCKAAYDLLCPQMAGACWSLSLNDHLDGIASWHLPEDALRRTVQLNA